MGFYFLYIMKLSILDEDFDFKILGEPVFVVGYGSFKNGTSLNVANQQVYSEAYCDNKYSVEDASTKVAKLITAELPNGFDDTLICSG